MNMTKARPSVAQAIRAFLDAPSEQDAREIDGLRAALPQAEAFEETITNLKSALASALADLTVADEALAAAAADALRLDGLGWGQ